MHDVYSRIAVCLWFYRKVRLKDSGKEITWRVELSANYFYMIKLLLLWNVSYSRGKEFNFTTFNPPFIYIKIGQGIENNRKTKRILK